MREIKFRAWQTNYKEMYQPLEGYIELNSDDVAVGFSDGDLILEGEDVVLMQYTGLKDKNGKEIYEGDVVETPHKLMGKYKWRVVFHRGAFVLTDGICVRRFDSNKFTKKYEVIGNLYENPDLLPK